MAEERVQTLEVEAALGAAGLAATTSLDIEVEELMEEIGNLQLQNQRLTQENVRLSEETVSQKEALKEVSSRHSRLSASAQELAGRARDAEVVAFALSEEMETIHEMVPKAKVEAEKALADAEEFEARLEEEKAMVLAEAEQAAQEQLEEQLEIKERQLESELASQGLESQQALDTARELAAKHKDALSEANKKMEDLRKEVATVLLLSLMSTAENHT
jgi:chromosome segregation ATPase